MTTVVIYPDSNTALTSLTGTGITSPMSDASMVLTTAGFTDPNNAHASDNVYATAAPAHHRMLGQLYFFSTVASLIASDAVLTSAKVQVQNKYSSASSGLCSAAATFASHNGSGVPSTMIGTQTGDLPDPGNSEPIVDTDWQHIFTPTTAQIRASTFNVAVFCDRASLVGPVTVSFDFVRLELQFDNVGSLSASGSLVGVGDYTSRRTGGYARPVEYPTKRCPRCQGQGFIHYVNPKAGNYQRMSLRTCDQAGCRDGRIIREGH